MNNKILITGASGFTGIHFIKLANSLGFECFALCHKGSDIVHGCSAALVANLADKQELKIQINKIRPTYVLHLAAVAFVGHANSTEVYQTNTLGTVNLLDALIELGISVNKILIPSSGNIYGNNKNLPISETEHPAPQNDYGISKYAMELATQIRFNRLPIILVRPFNYTGIGQHENFLIPKIVNSFKRLDKKIDLGNLDVSRDFSDVRDIVSAYIKLLLSDVDSEVFNVCSGKATSLSQVLETLNKLAGYPIEVSVNPEYIRENEIKELYGCNKKLISAIGDYQKYNLVDTLKWMLN